ncbi:hypothetical protein SAMN04488564_102286 [Lentzea waywayandensis]|uniref:Uncharacterized protein n=1 Tax=Lentzea waywayandensis TaxID=84724 RepID=A0A1I6DD28_9PSEU|nr:hypothetical protein SAMN04488564_102286 [Lentzea waywayandensis]
MPQDFRGYQLGDQDVAAGVTATADRARQG